MACKKHFLPTTILYITEVKFIRIIFKSLIERDVSILIKYPILHSFTIPDFIILSSTHTLRKKFVILRAYKLCPIRTCVLENDLYLYNKKNTHECLTDVWRMFCKIKCFVVIIVLMLSKQPSHIHKTLLRIFDRTYK